MLFTIPKALSPHLILQDIRSIAHLIGQLGRAITKNEETKYYFQKVELNQYEVANNLITHSNLISNLQQQLNTNSINLKSVDQLLNYLKQWFTDFKDHESNYSNIQKVIKVIELEGKLNCLEEFLTPALTYQDDIAAFPLGYNQKYRNAYNRIEVVECADAEKTRQDYKTFKQLMVITNASVLTELKQSNSLIGVMSFGLSYPRFWVDHKEAQLRNYAFLRKPQLNKLLSIWNLPQKGAISNLKGVQFPSIKVNRLIYIPLDQSRYQTADIYTPSERTVPVRVLSNRPVTFWNEQRQGCLGCFGGRSSQDLESLIIHAHGGGFVALSSSTMQGYTRRWSRQLDVPVFSIDYSKPPNFTFPDPAYDVYAVYHFISTQLYKHCNILPKKIVLAGDSAGSNLILSAYALAMKAKLKPAQGLFLAYPASDLRSVYTPSRLSAFTDAILHPSLLLLCLKQYLGTHHKQVESHPLASPLLLSEAFIGGNPSDIRWPLKWPPTRMMVGQLDPLLDDSVRLCAKMTDSGIDVRLKIYKQLGHGFLSVEKVIKDGEKGITDSILFLEQLLNYKKAK